MATPPGSTPRRIRSASRADEKRIVETARWLADNPDIVMPRCEGGCVVFSPTKKARRDVRRAHKAREDPDALKKLAKRGTPFGRAYAAVLRIAERGEIAYLGQAKLPWTTVTYAPWGDAGIPQHLGLQHWKDRRLRVLAVQDMVKKRKMRFYAVGDGLVCTGHRDEAPAEFVAQETKALGLSGEGERRTCPHGGAGDGAGLRIRWISAGITLDLCHRCIGEGNTLQRVLQHLASPEPWNDFEVVPQPPPWELRSGAEAPRSSDVVPPAQRDRYLRGEVGDEALVDAADDHRRASLRDHPGRLYVAGDAVFGDALEAFLDALDPTPEQRLALEAVLPDRDAPLILDRPSAVRALEELWDEAGLEALTAVAGDDAIAERLHAQVAEGDRDVQDVLEEAARSGRSARVDASLPAYEGLPGPAALADRVARRFRAGGRSAALQALSDARARDGREEGVVWALLLALDAAEGQGWRYGRTAKELGEALREPARALLEADAEAYHDALDALARRSGAGAIGAAKGR